MRLPHTSKLRLLLLAVLFVSFLFAGMPQLAQTGTQLGEPAGHVNDFAGVVSEKTRKQLERTLETLKEETKINFTIATVPTTGEQDIASFSRQLAREWNLGAPTSTTKSLLLVISIEEKDLFTRFSRSVQSSLPDGAIGEISRRVRPEIGSEFFSDVLSSGVLNFLTALGERVGFSLPTLEPLQETVSDSQVVAASSPSPPPQDESDNTVTALPITGEKTPPVRRSRRAAESPVSVSPTPAVKDENSERDADESEEVELTLTLPLDERVGALREFLRLNPNSKSKARAIELLVSAHATLGDQKLKADDNVSGIEHLLLAITEGPVEMSDQLFSGVIAQIPLNLYLRGERETAFKAASMIEAKHGSEPRRLLSLASFFLGLEMGNEAVRLAEQAVQLAPEMGEAHRVLALALHISLRLDEAISEYQRALELDPSLKGVRRSLADLYRASSNPKEALGLYRSIVEIEPTDKAARAGIVISLLDLKRTDEAESEFQAALVDDSKNLALLTGVAYWYAAHKDSKRALELALKAADVEPRYTWTQIALARALLGERRPLDAERAIRFARQYGKFATLDYELANVLAATGLFEEAAEVLLETFQIVEGEIQTRLAGQVQARADDFIELLSPERRAGIFQAVGADTPENAQKLKALLEFAIAIDQRNIREPSDETTIVKAGRAFAEGNDGMRALRKLYVATRLLRKGIAYEVAHDLALEARSGVEEALDHPAATVGVQADEYRDLRAQAIASGSTPDIAVAPRNALSNLLSGRIEELAGWALYNLDKPEEAAERFRRAISVLPEGTPLWRSTLWRLGAALEQLGNKQEAFNYYVKSYNTGEPDPARRSVIERLYEDLNGSLEGIDRYVGAGATLAASELPVTTPPAPSAEESTPSPSPEETPPASGEKTKPEVEPALPPEVDPSPTPSEPEPTPTPDSTPEPSPSPSEAPAKRKTDTARLSEQLVESTIPTTIKVSGKVRDSNKVGIANVVIVLISPRGTVIATTTDANGNYSFTVPPSQRGYRLIPSREGYFFNPADKILSALKDDVSEVNFVGAIVGGDS